MSLLSNCRSTRPEAEERFEGRYTAARLTSTTRKECQFVVVSYHGKWKNIRKERREKRTDSTAVEDKATSDNCRSFIRAVGAAASHLRMPAVIGGDWNFSMVDRKMPTDEAWEIRLK